MTRVIPETLSGISHLLRHFRPDREAGTTVIPDLLVSRHHIVIPDLIGNLNKNKNE